MLVGVARRVPFWGAVFSLLGLLWAPLLEAREGSWPGAVPRIAVAPFALDASLAESDLDLAGALAQHLAEGPLERVVGPSELGVAAQARPPAHEIREWAERAGVDTVVVGSAGRAENGRVEAWVETRSAHSGGVEAQYRIDPTPDQDLDGELELLSTRILADLGYRDPEPEALPPVGTAAPSRGEKSPDNSDDTLLGGLRGDEPISIQSDEIEVVDREGMRHIVFRRRVTVVQGDITLHTDHLEAFYPEGASQPDRLEATGNVRVQQGEQRGRCESATYLRKEQVIVCRGQAEIVRDCDRVRGREIRFDLERDSVRVVGAASVVLQAKAKGECAGGEP